MSIRRATAARSRDRTDARAVRSRTPALKDLAAVEHTKAKPPRTAADLSDDEVRELLSTFRDSDFRGNIRQYSGGKSGALVFLSQFMSTPSAWDERQGLDGPHVVKVDTYEWASGEKELYRSVAVNGFEHVAARYVDVTPPAQHQTFGAVAYRPAFDELQRSWTLREMLHKPTQSAARADQIQRLVAALVNWNQDMGAQREWLSPFGMIWKMFHDRVRPRVFPRLAAAKPCWELEAPYVLVDAHGSVLPNPVAFLRKAAWKTQFIRDPSSLAIRTSLACPVGRIHGDLNTGNVLCLPGERPQVIDFSDHRSDGVPFFDLAYLELDVLLHSLPWRLAAERENWLTVLDQCMDPDPKEHWAPDADVAAAMPMASLVTPFDLLRPIRDAASQIVARAVAAVPDDERRITNGYRAAWWAATVAAGLNFASKNGMYPPERTAALLYAAFGLQALFDTLGATHRTRRGDVEIIDWVDAGERQGGDAQGRAASEQFNELYRTRAAASRRKAGTAHLPRATWKQEALSGIHQDMGKHLESVAIRVTNCPDVASGATSCCICQHAVDARKVVLLTDTALTELSDLLKQMRVTGEKVLLLAPERLKATWQIRPGSVRKAAVFYDDTPMMDEVQWDEELSRHHWNDLTNGYVVGIVMHRLRTLRPT